MDILVATRVLFLQAVRVRNVCVYVNLYVVSQKCPSPPKSYLSQIPGAYECTLFGKLIFAIVIKNLEMRR